MSKQRLRSLVICCGIFVSLATSAVAQTILIDFGRADNQTTEGNFNNAFGAGTGLDTPTIDLIDSDGNATGITLNIDFSAGGSWAGTQADYAGPFPDAIVDQPATALQDSMFIRSPAASTFSFTGLDAEETYEVLIYGARGNNGGPNAEWRFTDNSGETMLAFDVFNNATEVASFERLVPDANNELTLRFTSTDDGSRPRGAMSFMQITVGGAEATPFEITSVDFDRDEVAPTYTVTWSSIPERDYALFFSTNGENWEEINDSIPSGGESTSFPHGLLPDFGQLVGVPTLFYRVELVPRN